MKLFLLLWAVSISAFSFTFNNNGEAHFGSPKIRLHMVKVNSTSCSHTGYTADEIYDMFDDVAQSYWNKVATSSLRLSKGDLLQGASYSSYQTTAISSLTSALDITIACSTASTNFLTNGSPNGAILGVTLPTNMDGSTVIGSVVLLNDLNISSLSQLTRDEFIAVIAHEIGHAVGLGHSETSASLMYYCLAPKRLALGEDDADGVTYLYPRREKFAGLLGCGSLAFDHDPQDPPGPWGPTKLWSISFLLGLFLTYLALKISPSLKLNRSLT